MASRRFPSIASAMVDCGRVSRDFASVSNENSPGSHEALASSRTQTAMSLDATRSCPKDVRTEMFLTSDQLVELTDSHRRQDQAKWLRENRFVFFYSRLGNIKVLRAHVEVQFGLRENVVTDPEPNWDALRKTA